MRTARPPALMATTTTRPMPAPLTATMAPHGLTVDSSSAPVPGSAVVTATDVAMAMLVMDVATVVMAVVAMPPMDVAATAAAVMPAAAIAVVAAVDTAAVVEAEASMAAAVVAPTAAVVVDAGNSFSPKQDKTVASMATVLLCFSEFSTMLVILSAVKNLSIGILPFFASITTTLGPGYRTSSTALMPPYEPTAPAQRHPAPSKAP